MPKNYFQVNRSTSLSALTAGAKIHVIGVSGVAMAQLACLLVEKGYEVSGSDTDFWEPMGGLLKRSSVKLKHGYKAENISANPDLVIIGNAIRYENPEVQEVEIKGYSYSFFPKLLSELVIKDRHSIVISGTHGKTTTTALGAFVLDSLGTNPSWFLGGEALQLESSLHVGTGSLSIVEGDEYDSAFFAKCPKFSFYRPDTLIVTSVEFDHADIYKDLESIKKEFTKLVCNMPISGRVLVCDETSLMKELVAEWRAGWRGTLLTYGCKESDYALLKCRQSDGVHIFEFRDPNGRNYTGTLRLTGNYNAQNALAIFGVCQLYGLASQEVLEAIGRFTGVKRRQEVRSSSNGIVIIEDFAHHPTAVLKTLEGIREAYPKHRIFVVFEPRSNTSRRKIFQNEYINALSHADIVAISNVVPRHNDTGVELLDVSDICATLRKQGIEADMLPDYVALKDHIISKAKVGDVIVMMSNGSFGGIIPEIVKGLKVPRGDTHFLHSA
ncbi:MAG: hypothetical protein GYA55_11490 [SAR324 cluster bacterium]|uniref:UDP-N-acetylmuramate--L-alanine ligase n=1 Tax=SAR324 cluster bacterium TaxID=2024889 RepID=A0A7X9FTT5_9DELT|nr:hypothetical protein [SAR324 cluster bacterium]